MAENLSESNPREKKCCCAKPGRLCVAAWTLPILLPVATLWVIGWLLPCVCGGCYVTMAVATLISAYAGIAIAKIVCDGRE